MARFRTAVVALVLPLLLASGCLKSRAQTGDREITIQSGGRTRSAIVHVPASYIGDRAVPLVLLLHGGGGNGAQAERSYGMNPVADREGFIVAYPNGTSAGSNMLTWNAANCCAFAYETDVDDVAFISALLDELSRRYTVDANRIYVTGMSNGAMMTYRLGCRLADRIAAIAPVAGALNETSCVPATPLPVIVFHGTEDTNVPYEGGEGPRQIYPRVDNSVAYAVSFWVNQDGCNPTPHTVTSASGNIVTDTYSGGREGSEVVLYTIRGGGHSWPGGVPPVRPGANAPTQEISASELMWEFFERHPKGSTAGTVRVTSPNGGEVVRRDETLSVSWEVTSSQGVVEQEVLLSDDGGDTFPVAVATGLDPAARSVSWTVPGALATGTRYLVRVVATTDASSFADESDANFRIKRRAR